MESGRLQQQECVRRRDQQSFTLIHAAQRHIFSNWQFLLNRFEPRGCFQEIHTFRRLSSHSGPRGKLQEVIYICNIHC